jgi:putative transposase
VARGVHLRGRQVLRGRWRSETEGATFGRAGRTDRKSRGRKDLLVAGIDGRSGFAEAIPVAAPEAKVPRGLVPLGRAARRYVADSDSRAVLADRTKIDRAATRLEAEGALAECAEVGDGKDPTIAKRWRPKWPDRVTLVEFPEPIRKALDTTHALERVHRVIRTFTRNRKLDPNGEAAIKGGVAIREAAKKGTMPIPHGKQALHHFAIRFEGRMPRLKNGTHAPTVPRAKSTKSRTSPLKRRLPATVSAFQCLRGRIARESWPENARETLEVALDSHGWHRFPCWSLKTWLRRPCGNGS